MTLLALLLACRPDSGLTKFNAAPEAQVTAPLAGDRAREGAAFTLRGAASDADDSPATLTARWRVDGALVCEWPAAADGSTECAITVPASDAAIVLEVLDPDGAVGTASATLGVDPDGAPVAEIVAPLADAVLYVDQLVTFRGRVSDAEDAAESLVAWWEDSVAGRLDTVDAVPTSGGEVLGYGLLSEGPHALELHVLDTMGNEAVASVIVDVGPPNSAPGCGITAPADGAVVVAGSAVRLEGTVSDVDVAAPVLSVSWSSDKDGLIGTSTPDSTGFVGLSTGTLSTDTHRVTLQVADELGAVCADAIYVTVGTPPSVSIDLPTDGEVVNEGASLALSATVSDAQDVAGDLAVRWESDLDGVVWSGAPDATGAVDTFTSTLSRGEHVLTAVVTDTDGLEARASVRAFVNGLPTAPVVTLSPSAPTTDDALLVGFTSAAVDPEGDVLTYTYAWTRDGVTSGASTSDVLPASATTRGERWTVTVRASDGMGEGPAGTAAVTVGNSLPALAGASITPSPARRGDTLTCTASGWTDADGDADASTYAWSLGGATVATGRTLASGFTAGDTLTCTVTPFDGTDAGTPVVASVTITNTTPAIVGVTLSPTVVRTNDTITAVATYSDPDGDALVTTWVWTVDGGVVAGATGDTLDGSAFARDQEVVAQLTVDDGAASVTLASAPLVVANTAPGAPVAAITPAAPEAGDPLVCGVAVAALDADTDPLAYTVTWTVDGAPYAGGTATWPGDTVPGSDVGWEETWTCSLVASDGTDTGPAATASVTTACALGSDAACPGEDCLDILTSGASTGDGTYWIDPTGSGAFTAYCDMTTDGGGWTRIANEAYSVDACPSGWSRSATWCTRPSAGGGSVATASWSAWGITWGETYGRVSGRIYYSTDGFHGPRDITTTTSIDGAYVDGIAITHGAAGSRQHVWSLAGGLFGSGPEYMCPADGGDSPPSFVASNYACVRWSGTSPGWVAVSTGTFSHTASGPTTSAIDMRIMLDESSANEDAGVDSVLLYVR